jgi:putative transposase
MALLAQISAVFSEVKRAYDWRRLRRGLAVLDIRAAKERVLKMTTADNFRARGKRKFRVTSDGSQRLTVSPTLLKPKFDVEDPTFAWKGDAPTQSVALTSLGCGPTRHGLNSPSSSICAAAGP